LGQFFILSHPFGGLGGVENPSAGIDPLARICNPCLKCTFISFTAFPFHQLKTAKSLSLIIFNLNKDAKLLKNQQTMKETGVKFILRQTYDKNHQKASQILNNSPKIFIIWRLVNLLTILPVNS